MEKIAHTQNGYITLMASIILSALLMMLFVTQSTAGFYARFSVLNHEQKTISRLMSLSCADIARLKIREHETYHGNDTVSLRGNPNTNMQSECYIGEINREFERAFFTTEAKFGQAHTTLETTISTVSFEILSTHEL